MYSRSKVWGALYYRLPAGKIFDKMIKVESPNGEGEYFVTLVNEESSELVSAIAESCLVHSEYRKKRSLEIEA